MSAILLSSPDAISIGLVPAIILLLLLLLIGWLFFRFSRWILSKLLKGRSQKVIRWWALPLSFLLTCLFLVIVFKIGLYLLINSTEIPSQRQESLDQDIQDMNLLGKTKEEVVDLLGETDTTSSKLIYDLPAMGLRTGN